MADHGANATLNLSVLGMTCAACQHHVESALLAARGVQTAHVDLMAHRATILFNSQLTGPNNLIEAIRAAGYDAVLPRAVGSAADTKQATANDQSNYYKTIVAITSGFIAMLLSMPLSSEMGATDRLFMVVLPWLYTLSHDLLRWSLLVMTAAVAIWAGRNIYVAAARALAHFTTNMNTLVALGTSVAFFYSAYSTIFPTDNHAVYYDAVLLIIGFLLAGKTLEGRAKQRALAALDALSHARPETARRIPTSSNSAIANDQSKAVIIPLNEVHIGDTLLVLPGERFPVDGILINGRTTVDESMLTGESTPLDRVVGDHILAGSLNYDGAVVCRAESLGETTVLARIAQMVQQAQSSRTPIEGLADRASAIFIPVVLCIAVLTFLVWLVLAHSLPMALANSVAVLVIACPCAMGLAVPAALTVAVGRGAQLGILFKGGEALERLSALDVVVLDKTGTLTVGRPTLIATHLFAAHTERELLRLAAAAEERSNHPLAHALIDAAQAQKLSWTPAEHVQILPGRGLTAKVEGHDCLLGNAALLDEHHLHLPTENLPATELGTTRLWMALDGQIAACFDARDTLRPGAAEAVAMLIRSGLKIRMLTGDSATAAQPIAKQAGISQIETDLDPAAKLARIRALQQSGLRVGMVGDGINDAAALAQADAGIALGTGADLAQEAGDVLLLRPDPMLIPTAVHLAQATIQIMKENLIWAGVYNLIGIPLAAGALYPAFHLLLSPWIAAVAMALSSVSVLANSLRLRPWSLTR